MLKWGHTKTIVELLHLENQRTPYSKPTFLFARALVLGIEDYMGPSDERADEGIMGSGYTYPSGDLLWTYITITLQVINKNRLVDVLLTCSFILRSIRSCNPTVLLKYRQTDETSSASESLTVTGCASSLRWYRAEHATRVSPCWAISSELTGLVVLHTQCHYNQTMFT